MHAAYDAAARLHESARHVPEQPVKTDAYMQEQHVHAHEDDSPKAAAAAARHGHAHEDDSPEAAAAGSGSSRSTPPVDANEVVLSADQAAALVDDIYNTGRAEREAQEDPKKGTHSDPLNQSMVQTAGPQYVNIFQYRCIYVRTDFIDVQGCPFLHMGMTYVHTV